MPGCRESKESHHWRVWAPSSSGGSPPGQTPNWMSPICPSRESKCPHLICNPKMQVRCRQPVPTTRAFATGATYEHPFKPAVIAAEASVLRIAAAVWPWHFHSIEPVVKLSPIERIAPAGPSSLLDTSGLTTRAQPESGRNGRNLPGGGQRQSAGRGHLPSTPRTNRLGRTGSGVVSGRRSSTSNTHWPETTPDPFAVQPDAPAQTAQHAGNLRRDGDSLDTTIRRC